MLITFFFLSDDIKESNLYKVGHDMFLKYLFLISLYFGQHNKNGILILAPKAQVSQSFRHCSYHIIQSYTVWRKGGVFI